MMRRSASVGINQGMALIAVLWLVAALAILVTGISYSVRSELRQVGVNRESVEARAHAEAAMVLALQQMLVSGQIPTALITGPVNYNGHSFDVQLRPMTGLIDINTAPPVLLVRLFEQAGGLTSGDADALAKVVDEARTRKNARGQSVRFDAIEDLLQLPGFDYELYAKLVGLIAVGAGGSGKVNLMAASPAVLDVISGGKSSAAAAFVTAREGGGAGLDTTAFDGSMAATGSTRQFEAYVRTTLPSDHLFLLTCTLDLSPKSKDGVPWRIRSCVHRLTTHSGKID